ncbi:MAG: acyl carrier protein [Candidatus Brocadiia bacterium]
MVYVPSENETPMTDPETKEVINDVFAEDFEIPREKLRPEAHIFEDLGLDSLDVVDLIAAIQKRFQVRVRDDERVRSVRTLGDLYEYLETVRSELEAKD